MRPLASIHVRARLGVPAFQAFAAEASSIGGSLSSHEYLRLKTPTRMLRVVTASCLGYALNATTVASLQIDRVCRGELTVLFGGPTTLTRCSVDGAGGRPGMLQLGGFQQYPQANGNGAAPQQQSGNGFPGFSPQPSPQNQQQQAANGW